MDEGTEKVEKVEKALEACQNAEMPYLKGVEVLPQDESEKAIADSEDAIMQAEKVIQEARIFINSKKGAVAKYTKENSEKITAELQAFLQKGAEPSTTLAEFKKTTMERKISTFMLDTNEAIAAVEKKIQAVAEAAEIFSTEDMDKITEEGLKDAGEKAGEAIKEATESMAAAEKMLTDKRKD